MEILYVKGDATNPTTNGNKVIVHVCNDIGGWGKGFVMALSAKWKLPENSYRQWFHSNEGFELGGIQLVLAEKDIWVCNLIGQRGIKAGKDGTPPVRYDAIETGLEKLSIFCNENNASVHMPRIGCGLAGGKWELMEPIIQKTLSNKELQVIVYDL
jgi:O-acetyl-ADP-ribose deacetylase (regulator of RNase III)